MGILRLKCHALFLDLKVRGTMVLKVLMIQNPINMLH